MADTNLGNSWFSIAEKVSNDVLGKFADEVDQEGRWPEESIQALAESGLLGLTVPQEFGGEGEGPGTFSKVNRILARHCASTAMIYLMHVCGTAVIVGSTEFANRESVLREIASGKHLTTLAFSEKGSRSHFWAPVSQAISNGTMDSLSSEKSWVTSANYADSYIVSTRTAGSSIQMTSTIYYVPKNVDGLSVSGPWNGMGLRGNASAPMRLENVKVPKTSRVCKDGDGFNFTLQVVLPWFQLGNASVSLGIARAATEATRHHLLQSKLQHLGESLASLMNLRARLAKMQVLTDMQEAFLDHVSRQMENPNPSTMLAVLESKASAGECALEVTDLAMRTCGGASFSRHLSVERNFRDARASYVMAPTTDVLYDFIAKSLLEMPLF